MPVSSHLQLNQIVDAVIRIKPLSVLDVGVGFGAYGFLCRQYLDVADDQVKAYTHYETVIDGIEAFEDYIRPHHKTIYNKIYIGNASDLIPKLERTYDLALIIDVLEHFSYEEGVALLRELSSKARNILVSTPKKLIPQGAVYGNDFETHRYGWKESDFHQFGACAIIPNEESLICIIGDQAPHFAHRFAARTRFNAGVDKRLPFLRKIFKRMKGSQGS